jgi:hypothetical protein
MTMNEPNRHAVWVLGMVGSITLSQWNTIVGIACGAAGFVAACLSIYSWVEKRRRKARELRDHGTTDHGPRDHKRRHHRKTLLLFLVILGLMLTWALIAGAAEGQTTNTEGGGLRIEDSWQSAWAVQVADDVRKLVYDFLSGFSWAGLFAAYLGVKGLRNFTPLGRSAGKIGTLLRLINLEANALKQMSEQQTETKGKAQQ